MKNRPLILKGNINIKNTDEYIIGKIIKNKNIENKETYIQVLNSENIDLYEKGYKGYIFETEPKKIDLNLINYCYNVKDFQTLKDYDVVEIINNKSIRVLYRDDSEDNAIVVTNQCNSNCIMCPDPDIIRSTKENPDIKKILEQIECIPNDTSHITITGGEPGLLKEKLLEVLDKCKKCLPNTEFLLLTNGRVFSDVHFANKIAEVVPSNIRVAIPIYADNEKLHDEITRAKESFNQAVNGIKNLINRNIDVEIRIVVLKKNFEQLEQIAKFIVREFPHTKIVNIMALEMLGNAYKNKDWVWVDFKDIKKYLYNACLTIIRSGIITNLYNFPLCNIDEKLYSLSRKSITDYKVRYKDGCDTCLIKESCGGFFNSTINIKDISIKPIKKEE